MTPTPPRFPGSRPRPQSDSNRPSQGGISTQNNSQNQPQPEQGNLNEAYTPPDIQPMEDIGFSDPSDTQPQEMAVGEHSPDGLGQGEDTSKKTSMFQLPKEGQTEAKGSKGVGKIGSKKSDTSESNSTTSPQGKLKPNTGGTTSSGKKDSQMLKLPKPGEGGDGKKPGVGSIAEKKLSGAAASKIAKVPGGDKMGVGDAAKVAQGIKEGQVDVKDALNATGKGVGTYFGGQLGAIVGEYIAKFLGKFLEMLGIKKIKLNDLFIGSALITMVTSIMTLVMTAMMIILPFALVSYFLVRATYCDSPLGGFVLDSSEKVVYVVGNTALFAGQALQLPNAVGQEVEEWGDNLGGVFNQESFEEFLERREKEQNEQGFFQWASTLLQSGLGTWLQVFGKIIQIGSLPPEILGRFLTWIGETADKTYEILRSTKEILDIICEVDLSDTSGLHEQDSCYYPGENTIADGSSDSGSGANNIGCLAAPRNNITGDPYMRALARAIGHAESGEDNPDTPLREDYERGGNILDTYGKYQWLKPYDQTAWGAAMGPANEEGVQLPPSPEGSTNEAYVYQDIAFFVWSQRYLFNYGFDDIPGIIRNFHETGEEAELRAMLSQLCWQWEVACAEGQSTYPQQNNVVNYLKSTLPEELDGSCGETTILADEDGSNSKLTNNDRPSLELVFNSQSYSRAAKKEPQYSRNNQSDLMPTSNKSKSDNVPGLDTLDNKETKDPVLKTIPAIPGLTLRTTQAGTPDTELEGTDWLNLPFPEGESRVYTGGPHHGGTGYGPKPWNGIDFGGAFPVTAAAPGEIYYNDGCIVMIDHGNGYGTRYIHLDGVPSNLSIGTRVDTGEFLGNGSAKECGGSANGPHVHFDIIKDPPSIERASIQDFVIGGWNPREGAAAYQGDAINVFSNEVVPTGGTITNDGYTDSDGLPPPGQEVCYSGPSPNLDGASCEEFNDVEGAKCLPSPWMDRYEGESRMYTYINDQGKLFSIPVTHNSCGGHAAQTVACFYDYDGCKEVLERNGQSNLGWLIYNDGGRNLGATCPNGVDGAFAVTSNSECSLTYDMAPFLKQHGVSSTSHSGEGLTFDTIKQEINNNRPIIISINTSLGGHIISCHGYIEGTQEIICHDSWKNLRTGEKSGKNAVYQFTPGTLNPNGADGPLNIIYYLTFNIGIHV
jgi:murein DD-endopeptidase MepM/ murein hydrolase activator NlpD